MLFDMPEEIRFPIYILASFILYGLIIQVSLRKIPRSGLLKKILLSGLIVVILGMLIGKYGHNVGLPWWIYYPVPVLLSLLFPPLYFKMSWRETVIYLILGLLSAPFIHYSFYLLLGWRDYMPFL
jgi:hypothetical protein